MDCDLRDVLGTPETTNLPAVPPFPFLHRVHKNDKNRSIVEVPMLSYGVRNDNEVRKAKLNLNTKPENQPIADGLDNSLRDFVERHGGEESFEYQMEKKQFELNWPDHVQLDGECLECNKGEKQLELKLQGHTYLVSIDSLNKPGKDGQCKKVTVQNTGGMDVELDVWKMAVQAKLIWRVADKNARKKLLGKLSHKKQDASTKAAQAMMEDLDLDS